MIYQEVFAWIGLIVVGLLMAITITGLIVFGSVWVVCRFPRFHAGRTKHPCEWHCYESGGIITTKDGGAKEPERRLVQRLNLLWWCGMSSRNDARWFFGFMRWNDAR